MNYLPLSYVFQELHGRQVTGCGIQAASGPRGLSGQIQAFYGGPVPGPPAHRPEAKELVQVVRTANHVAAHKVGIVIFEIPGGVNHRLADDIPDVRGIASDLFDDEHLLTGLLQIQSCGQAVMSGTDYDYIRICQWRSLSPFPFPRPLPVRGKAVWRMLIVDVGTESVKNGVGYLDGYCFLRLSTLK